MNRMEQLFQKLGYDRENGLFFTAEADEWMGKFPYRIGRILKDIIRPYAFYSPFHGVKSTDREHPEPLNNPIILFFDHPDEDAGQNIPRWTFSFSQAPIVIINRDDSGPLDIYHGYNFDGRKQPWLEKINDDDVEIEDFSILSLSTGKTWEKLYERYFKNTPRVDQYLLKNISDARRILIAKDTGGLSPRTANRLIGRLLFLRYLIDRNAAFEDNRYIKGESKTERQKSLEDLLRNKEEAYCFFKSITGSFNGDLFPLLEKDQKGVIVYDEEKNVEQKHLDVMFYLFTCSEFFGETGNRNGYKGYIVQKSFFNFYDFEVIPVELISNIYENFLAESPAGKDLKDFSRQKEIKAYYTPPFLVDYILSETVIPHLARQGEASCKVLDPACGSGIFLVETLRKLIEKEMELTPKSWPGNKPVISDRRLWELVQENIFGIDIDSDAVEITIFSIYITLLDYKNPKEIQSFRFKKIKNKNLFAGADFFDENHPFNKILKDEVQLDFIIGNPPWGSDVPDSKYKEYIENRKNREKKDTKDGNCDLEISGNEISQAFMVRTGDFASPCERTGCALVVTGKNLYNADAAKWRNYFLNHFCISKVFELSAINNKNSGGPKIFEKAKQPAVVISFSPMQKNEIPGNSLVTHVTARANYYWDCFKTIIIEKQDVKKILQKYFMEPGGYDWLWKVLLHGNILDFNFIRRLKESSQTLAQVMDELNLTFKGGLKPVDNSIKPGNRKSTEEIKNWKYLEINESKGRDEFQQYIISPAKSFKEKLSQLVKTGKINADEKVAQLPGIYFFKGMKLLLKNGLSPDFRAFAAVYDEDLVFTDSVCSIKPKPGELSIADIYFHILAGLFNSDFFTYFILITGSSAGIERTRANFADFFNFPTILDRQIGVIAEKIKKNYEKLNSECPTARKKELRNEIEVLRVEIENVIADRYGISEEEKALIDYAVNVSIPVFKRPARRGNQSANIFRALAVDIKEDRDYLQEYAGVFIDHFGQRFNDDKKYFVVDIHVTPSFIGFHFRISPKPGTNLRVFFMKDTGIEEMIDKIGDLGYHKLSRDLYIRQDIRGFNKTSFYVIKANQRKSWHKAAAYADLSEFIESLVKAEIEKKSA